jgi:hypothetical protein
MIMDKFINCFISPLFKNLTFSLAPWVPMVVGTLGSLFGGGSSGPEQLSIEKLKQMQAPTQGLIDEQLGLSRGLMDPNSPINLNMRRLMSQRALETGQQVGNQAMKMAAMRGVSPGQALMHQRMAQNAATGDVNQRWLNSLQTRFGQGLGLMGNMTQVSQGLNENLMNAYGANVSASNQGGGSMLSSILPGLMMNMAMGGTGTGTGPT